jgi:type II secretory pathway pseudopilin PulG
MTNRDSEHSSSGRAGAFTLVEVVIAVGIFASCAVVVLSLLPSLVRQTAEPAQFQIAQRMFDSLRIELQHRSATVGFDALANSIPVMDAPLRNGLGLIATADGMRIELE